LHDCVISNVKHFKNAAVLFFGSKLLASLSLCQSRRDDLESLGYVRYYFSSLEFSITFMIEYYHIMSNQSGSVAHAHGCPLGINLGYCKIWILEAMKKI
ncbi:hypothetical protein ACJX0J_009326, partial [Zea mays]